MVDRVCKEFKNVIVVVNSSNAMELGWLDQYDSIKAAVLCGAPGELGFDSLGKILNGEVNPSGHLADTYVYDLLATPTVNNFGGFAYDNLSLIHILSVDACANGAEPDAVQPELFGLLQAAAVCAAQELGIARSACVNAVSYTHLDVYKRQTPICLGSPKIKNRTSAAVMVILT